MAPPEQLLFEHAVRGADGRDAAGAEAMQLKLRREHLSRHLRVGRRARSAAAGGSVTRNERPRETSARTIRCDSEKTQIFKVTPHVRF